MYTICLLLCLLFAVREDGKGWEGEKVNRLTTEGHPGVWHGGGLGSDGVEGRGVGRDGHGGRAEVDGRVEKERGIDTARHCQEKRETTRLGKLHESLEPPKRYQ